MEEDTRVECTSPDSVEMGEEQITVPKIYKTLDQRSNTGNVAKFVDQSFGRLFADTKIKVVDVKSERDSAFDSAPSSPHLDLQSSEFDFDMSQDTNNNVRKAAIELIQAENQVYRIDQKALAPQQKFAFLQEKLELRKLRNRIQNAYN